MAQEHIHSTLDRAIADGLAASADYRKRAEEMDMEVVHLRAAAAILRRNHSAAPSPTNLSLAGVFTRGEAFSICKLALSRHPDGLSTRELAAACLKAKNFDPEDKQLRRTMMQNIAQLMHVHKRSGLVEVIGKQGVMCIWRLVGDT